LDRRSASEASDSEFEPKQESEQALESEPELKSELQLGTKVKKVPKPKNGSGNILKITNTEYEITTKYDARKLFDEMKVLVSEDETQFEIIGNIPVNRLCGYSLLTGKHCQWSGINGKGALPKTFSDHGKCRHYLCCNQKERAAEEMSKLIEQQQRDLTQNIDDPVLMTMYCTDTDDESKAYTQNMVQHAMHAYCGSNGVYHSVQSKTTILMKPLLVAYLNERVPAPSHMCGDDGYQYLKVFASLSHDVLLAPKYMITAVRNLCLYIKPYRSLGQKLNAILKANTDMKWTISQIVPKEKVGSRTNAIVLLSDDEDQMSQSS